MSTAEKVATQVGALCVGGTAFALGDPSGGALLAVPLSALTAIGLTLKSGCAEKAAGKARKAVLKALKDSPEFSEALPRAKALLDSLPKLGELDPQAVARLTHGQDFETALCGEIVGALGVGESDRALQTVMRSLVQIGIRACKDDTEFRQKLTLELLIETARKQGHEIALLGDIKEDTAALLDGQKKAGEEIAVLHTKIDSLSGEKRDETQRLIEETSEQAVMLGVQEKLLVRLAERYAEGNPAGFDGALAGLERALEVAAEERDRLPGNVSHAVEAVMARVEELNGEGEIDAAEEALWDELERAEAAQLRLIDKGLVQVVLTRNVDRAVALELKKLALDGGGFEALRTVRRVWHERGRDKGLQFDLEVSIGLAETSVQRATDPDQRGDALNDLGKALATLGERERGAERLMQAVVAFENALKEMTRDRVLLARARVQNNLGTALATLGVRESGTERLLQAVVAFENALTGMARDWVPLDWAATQNNLANALQNLGERESGTGRLQQAVVAYENALLEWTRDLVPLQWAMTQNNLGAALKTLGTRNNSTERLRQAVHANENALMEWTRDRVPLDWAMAQNNLGNAQACLGERESGTETLRQAVVAYENALLEWPRDQVPLQWATAQSNLSVLELAFFDKAPDPARLDAALTHAEAAREVFEEAGADHYVQRTDRVLARIERRRDELR